MKTSSAQLWLFVICSLLLNHTVLQAVDKASPKGRPNVLIFVIDDLGRTDIGVDGSTFHETPYLDALARSGVRFTNFYSAHPVCSPTRAALMTGKVPQRLGITDWIHPKSGIALPASETTLGEAFQQQGYQTAYLGKWHLGESDVDLPTKHGFEWIKGVNRAGQPASYYYPYRRQGEGVTVWDVPDFSGARETDYLTDVLSSAAIDFLQLRDRERPFLLCFGHYAVHTPIQPPAKLPEKYRNKRQARYGDAAAQTITAPNDSVSRGRQDDTDYAAMMENLDQNVGRVLVALEKSGDRQNTIVVLTSDNGGLCTLSGQRPGPTCNLPWRSGKGWTYEGGIRIPTYISWPDHLTPATIDVPGYSSDFYPTLLELCGLPLQPQQHRDGRSLVSALNGQPDAGLLTRSLAWYYPHNHGSGHRPSAAIRRESWKLIYDLNDKQCQLYDLAHDSIESIDLSATHPDKVKLLTDELLRWIEETKPE